MLRGVYLLRSWVTAIRTLINIVLFISCGRLRHRASLVEIIFFLQVKEIKHICFDDQKKIYIGSIYINMLSIYYAKLLLC
jgi:hypothetical protein